MRRGEHQSGIGRGGGDRRFFLRLRAPEEEGDRLRKAAEGGNDLGCKFLPAEVRVTVRLSRSDGQNGVEQQNALPCPCAQISLRGRLCGKILPQLTENIPQRWRQRNARACR